MVFAAQLGQWSQLRHPASGPGESAASIRYGLPSTASMRYGLPSTASSDMGSTLAPFARTAQ